MKHPVHYVVQPVGVEMPIVFMTGSLREAKKYCRDFDSQLNPLTITKRQFVCFGNEA